MKEKQQIRDVLGLTHAQLATLLNVPRTQLSRFETGTGNISINAKYLLAEMLGHIQAPETSLKRSAAVKEEMLKLQGQLKRMLNENEYQQLLIARKIGNTEKIYNNKIKALHLVEFLSSREMMDEVGKGAALRTIRNTAIKSLKENGLVTITKLKIKMELLQHEKIFLQAELRKLMLDIDFIGNSESI